MIEGDAMRCRKQKIKSAVWFGAGLLIATLLPAKWTLVVASASLVVVSISCFRR